MGEMIDKAKGAANVAAGKTKKAMGRESGDADMAAKGGAQEAKGRTQKAKGAIKGALGNSI